MTPQVASPKDAQTTLLGLNPRRVLLATQGINSDLRPPEVREKLQSPEPAVMGGDWDDGAWGTRAYPIEQLQVHEAIRQSMIEGRPWEDTRFFQRVVRQMAAGTPKWGCRTPEEFKDRCETAITRLFETIERDGYKSQAELGRENSIDEIRVGIRRDGRFVLFDGRHRLAIAQLLELPEVPVNVVVRHEDWIAFKERLIGYANDELGGRLYQQLDHPDLADIPAKHRMQRLPLLIDGLEGHIGTGESLLDLGTHWGEMCRQMERIGFQCVGIEANADAADFARRLAIANEASYGVWEGDLGDHPGGHFDVVLALSIFHQLLKTPERHENLIGFLERLDTDLMIFEPHDPELSARQMKDAYRNYPPDEFVQFVSERARLPNVEFLGRADDEYRRPVYKLSR